jgi:acylglycerol lipase
LVVFPDRRGSGANTLDRGHTPSAGRLIRDLVEMLQDLRRQNPGKPLGLVGISWGGKLAVVVAARRPDLVDRLALVCPGLHPRVGVSRRERLAIAWGFFFNRRKTFPIPLADPALFTDNPAWQAFIANDPLSLRQATAGLLAASFVIDLLVKKAQKILRTPTLLMLSGKDRIVDNARTRQYFEGIAAVEKGLIEYPDGCHTLEFDANAALYARDLIRWFDRPSATSTISRGLDHGTHQTRDASDQASPEASGISA